MVISITKLIFLPYFHVSVAVLLDKFVFKLLKSLPGLSVPRLHCPLHVDPDDGGSLPGDGLQLGPVGHVAPAGQGEVDVVAVGHLLLGPGKCKGVNQSRSEGVRVIVLPSEDVSPGVCYRGAGCMEALDVNSMNRRTGLDFI